MAGDKRNAPHPHPVRRIELSEEHLGLRIIAVAVLALLGLFSIGYAVTGLLGANKGWEIIEANNGSLADVAEEFVFQYQLGAGEMSPTAEKKALTLLYNDLTKKAYQMFEATEEFEGICNLAYLNSHCNEEVVLEEELYLALQDCLEGGSRALYLGPLYGQYRSLFFSMEDPEAAECDPAKNEQLRKDTEELLVYATDPAQIELRLLDGYAAMLYVSEQYRQYLEENWDGPYLDFDWMKNAFVIDYLAEELKQAGFTHGNLSSYDGFIRNLDQKQKGAAIPLSRREGREVMAAGSFCYDGEIAFVYLRDYPLSAKDREHYYEYADGEIRVPYVSTQSGLTMAAIDTMAGYLYGKTTEGSDADGLKTEEAGGSVTPRCGKILTELVKLYVQEGFQEESLKDLDQQGICYLFFQENEIVSNDKELSYR